MVPLGNKVHIKKALEKLRILNECDNITERNYREMDGMIALAVFSKPSSTLSYISPFSNGQFPYALVMNSKRTTIHDDVIEFANPSGPGFIIMNASKVPHFTTKIDDGLLLLANAGWTMSHTGLAKCEYNNLKFREKLRTTQLSLCAIGLQWHFSL